MPRLAAVVALLSLGLLAAAAPAEVLRFTLPSYDAYESIEGYWVPYCTPSPAPVGPVGEVRLYQLGYPSPEQVHPAGATGSLDSFLVDVSDGEQRTYYVTTTKLTGVESCRSNLVTLNGRLAAQEPAPGAWLGIPRPNPTRGLVVVSLRLPEAGAASLEVLDIAGRRLTRLFEGERAAGIHLALWDTRQVAPGIYLMIARLGAWRAARRVLVLR